jgi:uncharacterized protein
MIGAGGTPGGIPKFLLGIALFIVGMYLLLKNIYVQYNFGFSSQLYRWGGISVNSGMLLLPFMLGLGMIFYNSKKNTGWILAVGSISLLMIGIITSINFTLAGMSALDILIILTCIAGGLGLFLSSLRRQ